MKSQWNLKTHISFSFQQKINHKFMMSYGNKKKVKFITSKIYGEWISSLFLQNRPLNAINFVIFFYMKNQTSLTLK